MRTTFFAAAAAAALLAGCGIGAPAYPQFGETSYRIEGTTTSANGGAGTQTVIYRDGSKMRVEAALSNYGQAAIVYDDGTSAAYVLNPTAQGATTAPPPASTQVAGVAVRIDDADAPQPLEAAWDALGADNARSAGACEVAGEDGHLWRPREDSADMERMACITDDGIVLRVTQSGRTLWEATSLQRGQQDAALFGVPAGYQLIDPEAVAERVGENMQQLDSVTGAPQAPQEAPAPRG